MRERVPVFVATRSRSAQVRGGEECSDGSPRRLIESLRFRLILNGGFGLSRVLDTQVPEGS